MIDPDISSYVGSDLELLSAFESLESQHRHLGHQIAVLYAAIDKIIHERDTERFERSRSGRSQ